MPGFDEWFNNVSQGWHDFWNDPFWTGFSQNFNSAQSTGPSVPVGGSSPSFEEQYAPQIEATKVVNDIKNSGFLDSVGSSALDSKSAVDQFLDLYKKSGDSAFLEKYLDTLIERENTASARAYETEMSNTSFSRLMKDISSAGYNPWLALQGSLGTASTPSVSSAGSSSVNVSSQKTSKENQSRQEESEIISRVIMAVGVVIAAILAA